eukprot:6204481-Pleurochrysis_carterae.AAC.1
MKGSGKVSWICDFLEAVLRRRRHSARLSLVLNKYPAPCRPGCASPQEKHFAWYFRLLLRTEPMAGDGVGDGDRTERPTSPPISVAVGADAVRCGVRTRSLALALCRVLTALSS